MEKGHYGHYTGNARHSRKKEMIHDREMIYDAKSQIHNEDKKYRETGRDGYKQDMIHERELIHDTKSQLHRADSDYKGDSPAHLSYSSKFGGMTLKDPVSNGAYTNFDGGAAGDIAAMKQEDASLKDLHKINTDVGNQIIKGGGDTGGGDVEDTGGGDVDKKSLEKYLPKVGLNPFEIPGAIDLVALGKKGQSSLETAVPQRDRESMTFQTGSGNFSGQSAKEKLGRNLTSAENTWMNEEKGKLGVQGYRNKYGIGSQDFKDTTVTGYDLETD